MLREQTFSSANWYIKQNRDTADLTMDKIRQELLQTENSTLLRHIMRRAEPIKGTRPFWNGERYKLETIARWLGVNCLFVTFSAADVQWEDLQRHMPRYREWREAGSDLERSRIANKNLQDNPHIASAYLEKRFNTFFKCVLKPKFKVIDHWFRYKWQSRGSGHIHSFLWCEDTPHPNMSTPEFRQEFAEYWSQHLTAVNPDVHRRPDARHPCSIPIHQQGNTIDRATALLNRVNRHTRHSPAYCLRKDKRTKELRCRFRFPRPLRTVAAVTPRDNGGAMCWEFSPERNDELLQQFNGLVLMGWSANTDLSPSTSLSQVLKYAAKYCTKEEHKSTSYAQIASSVCGGIENSRRGPAMRTVVVKMLNSLVGERDWSAQEVCHLFLCDGLVQTSREVIKLQCAPERAASDVAQITPEREIRRTRTPWEKYQSRPQEGEDITLLDYLRHYNHIGQWRRRPRAKARCINFYPRYSPDPLHDDYSKYCRVKMLLHHPYRREADLLVTEDGSEMTWVVAFSRCRATHGEHEFDTLEQTEEPDEDQFDPPEEEEPLDNEPLEAWQALRQIRAEVEPDDADSDNNDEEPRFVLRPMDIEYDWSTHIANTMEIPPTWWRDQINAYGSNSDISTPISPDTLNPGQRLIYDHVITHYRRCIRNGNEPPLCVNIDGSGGTGKSYLINCIVDYFNSLPGANPDRCPIALTAPTGVAAFNIGGRTLHSLLRLPMKSSYNPLPTGSLATLQDAVRHVRYVVIDEKSMVGLTMMANIKRRLRELFPECHDQRFGGRSILLFGDFYQLPPVKDVALFQDVSGRGRLSEDKLFGRSGYLAIDKTARLDQAMRQRGTNDVATRFRTALANLRVGSLERADWELLTTRCKHRLSAEEVATFDGAIRLYATKKAVGRYNHRILQDHPHPVLCVKARNLGHSIGRNVSTEDAENLAQRITISRGCRVMLTRNIWVEKGVVNGALGTVYDIQWESDTDVRTNMPYVVLVKLDAYDGPGVFVDPHDGRPVVPIFRTTVEFKYMAEQCSRCQFAITPAYAITIHKSQGMTLNKAVIDVNYPEYAPGLKYVSISRVKSLSGIMFDTEFDMSVFSSGRGTFWIKRVADEVERGRQLLSYIDV
ncbi:ATP-dependent DNA helicase PIF1 [Microsporum canis CBS 113480]|uniref:ATP-dependent DNA helicase n=1 Tax=Arthroderma otae (strain ATCC MYA-4605 / CBS 113480) TaxID=554155 RepID=C5FMV1_ARTOC|nr:ATP-dependent DNA helicase PIF1 [Microsporum canis CBS 113480]EEQ31187.1 ATP-dependent DNA helicase PIF1 [Microsporum canis CBS 113480]